MLKSKMDALSYVGGVNVFDADGKLINASAVWPVPRSASRTGPTSKPSNRSALAGHAGRAGLQRITGVWTTVIARKITGPNASSSAHRARHRAGQLRKILRQRGA